MKCGRCQKRKAQPLHYLCRECYSENDGEPRNPGKEIIRLERQRDAYAETLRVIATANARTHHRAAFTDLISERHPELAENTPTLPPTVGSGEIPA